MMYRVHGIDDRGDPASVDIDCGSEGEAKHAAVVRGRLMHVERVEALGGGDVGATAVDGGGRSGIGLERSGSDRSGAGRPGPDRFGSGRVELTVRFWDGVRGGFAVALGALAAIGLVWVVLRVISAFWADVTRMRGVG